MATESEPRQLDPSFMIGDMDDDPEWDLLYNKLSGMPSTARRSFLNETAKRYDDELRNFSVSLNAPENKWLLSRSTSRPQSEYSTFLKAYSVDFEVLRRVEAEARTRTRVAIIALLAREQAWQHGAYPASLKDFLPESSIVDPLTNQPYKYSITNGAVIVKTAAHPVLGEISLRRPPRSDAGSGSKAILP